MLFFSVMDFELVKFLTFSLLSKSHFRIRGEMVQVPSIDQWMLRISTYKHRASNVPDYQEPLNF